MIDHTIERKGVRVVVTHAQTEVFYRDGDAWHSVDVVSNDAEGLTLQLRALLREAVALRTTAAESDDATLAERAAEAWRERRALQIVEGVHLAMGVEVE